MADNRFSTPGKPPTAFEEQLLLSAGPLEDPWVEIAQEVGLHGALRIMDRFARCNLSCPSRGTFVARLLRVWQDAETLRLLQERPRLSMREIARRIGLPPSAFRKRRARALKRVPRRIA